MTRYTTDNEEERRPTDGLALVRKSRDRDSVKTRRWSLFTSSNTFNWIFTLFFDSLLIFLDLNHLYFSFFFNFCAEQVQFQHNTAIRSSHDIKFIAFFNMNLIYGDNLISLITISGKLFIDFSKAASRLKNRETFLFMMTLISPIKLPTFEMKFAEVRYI